MSVMHYTDVELRRLACRAMPLHQRRICLGEAVGAGPEAVDRLNRWRDVLSLESDDDVFAQRLSWNGWDTHNCLSVLGSDAVHGNDPHPEWACRLNKFLQSYASDESVLSAWNAAATELTTAHWSDEPLPFFEVWVPLVVDATRDLRIRAGTSLQHLSENALGAFQVQLFATITHVSALTMNLEFRRFVARQDPLSIVGLKTEDSTAPPRELYRQFVRHLQGGHLVHFFEKYADLARLVMNLAIHWAEHLAEFCQRLQEDRIALSSLFHQGAEIGPVAEVKVGVSDPHNGRREVVIATFKSGLKLVYKPKDLAIDVAFWSFVEWLNRESAATGDLALRILRVLNRKTHGWVEFVERDSCHDSSAIARYYERVGMLLGVTYVLGATDFHHENILASGEQPLLVDLETMLHPLPRAFDGLRASSADERAIEVMHDSVLRIGLLPFWIAGDRGRSYDVSGIGAEDEPDSGHQQLQWEDINTDRMRPEYQDVTQEGDAVRPMLNGEVASARNYVAEIIEIGRAHV